MKAEQLKGKTMQLEDFPKETYQRIFTERDIKSAVKWLKEKVEKGSPSEVKGYRPGEAHPHYYDMNPEEVLEAIDEAFQDVVECRKGTR